MLPGIAAQIVLSGRRLLRSAAAAAVRILKRPRQVGLVEAAAHQIMLGLRAFPVRVLQAETVSRLAQMTAVAAAAAVRERRVPMLWPVEVATVVTAL